MRSVGHRKNRRRVAKNNSPLLINIGCITDNVHRGKLEVEGVKKWFEVRKKGLFKRQSSFQRGKKKSSKGAKKFRAFSVFGRGFKTMSQRKNSDVCYTSLSPCLPALAWPTHSDRPFWPQYHTTIFISVTLPGCRPVPRRRPECVETYCTRFPSYSFSRSAHHCRAFWHVHEEATDWSLSDPLPAWACTYQSVTQRHTPYYETLLSPARWYHSQAAQAQSTKTQLRRSFFVFLTVHCSVCHIETLYALYHHAITC